MLRQRHRAHAVSSTLTALSGSCRPDIYRLESLTAIRDSLVKNYDFVMLLQCVLHPTKHDLCLPFGWLVHLYHLKAPCKRCVLLEKYFL